MSIFTAARFVKRLTADAPAGNLKQIRRHYKPTEGRHDDGDVFVGVPMREVFGLAKEFIEMPPGEIEELLESPIHEVRVGGVSIMDKQARRKRTPERHRQEHFELYLSPDSPNDSVGHLSLAV